jgi:hypothetical protein
MESHAGMIAGAIATTFTCSLSWNQTIKHCGFKFTIGCYLLFLIVAVIAGYAIDTLREANAKASAREAKYMHNCNYKITLGNGFLAAESCVMSYKVNKETMQIEAIDIYGNERSTALAYVLEIKRKGVDYE